MSLKNNKITGNLPTQWPIALIDLNLGDNLLVGTIVKLPANIKMIYLANNDLSGTLPSDLPQTLTKFYVNGNSLTGTVPFLPNINQIHLGMGDSPGNSFSGALHLPSPTEFWLNGNDLTDIIVDSYSKLDNCDISNNPLLDSPHLSEMSMCKRSGLTSKNADKPVGTMPLPVPLPLPVPVSSPLPSTNANNSLPLSSPTTTSKANEPKQVQNSIGNSAVNRISNSTIVIIILAIVLFILLIIVLAVVYCRRKRQVKRLESEIAFSEATTISFTTLGSNSAFYSDLNPTPDSELYI